MIAILSLAKNIPLIVIGCIGIGLLIGFHELGHFTFCKIFKIKTPSFSIGFGPHIFKKKIGDTLFSLSAIPFGGYVEIAGIKEVGQGEQKDAHRDDDQSFASKPYYQKLLVLSGGILFNLILAYFFMTLLFAIGMPKTPLLGFNNIPPVIGQIMPDSAAAKYKLEVNDNIMAVGDTHISSSTELQAALQNLGGKDTTLLINRNNQTIHKNITIGSAKAGGKTIGQLGILFAPAYMKPLPIFKSIRKGFTATNLMASRMFTMFSSMFKNREFQNVGGPISIISELFNGAKRGAQPFILLLMIISMNLAILNLIPIPILDGGQILFTTIEAVIGKPIPETIKLGVHYVCWIAAMGAFLYLSYRDIFKLLK